MERTEIVAAMKCQFSYLCCFDSNIERLRNAAAKLADARDRVAEADHRNAEMNTPDVKTWLENADTMIQDNLSKLERDIENVRNGRLNVKSRYLLSRKARNTAEDMEKLRASAEDIFRQGASIGIYSRKQVEEAIMDNLRGRGDWVHTIGISGRRGVGKTIMAKNIMNRAKEEKLFDEVVMVQQVNIHRIQSEVAQVLGLRLRKEGLSARAHKLHARLTMWPMRILLILDDVRKSLTLEDILGLTCSMIFTIVLTSENENVLREMNAKLHVIKTLCEDEAWFLVSKKFWTWIDIDSDLLSLAKGIVKECKGLPLYLTIVGVTLENERRKNIWEDALVQLKQADECYSPFRLSYKLLDEDTKSLFLLCCLFPQGCDIHFEFLTLWSIGLDMVAGTMCVKKARNIVRTTCKMLTARTLLLDGCDENHVRMHEVVRDAAMFLAAREGRVVDSLSAGAKSIKCKWISVHGDEIKELPIELSFPSLHLLMMHNCSEETKINTVDPGFFQGMTELNVLSFRGICVRSLPQTMQLLKNLRTLYLEGCTSLETISIVGELLSLEILICHYCDMIVELPEEIGRLNKLRMLEVYKCRRMKTIAREVISKLVRLEELMIVESFNKWEMETNGEQRKNAAISEIAYLKNLTRLEIEIEDSTLAADMMFLDEGKVKYQIKFRGNRWESCELDDTHSFFAQWIQDIVNGMVLKYNMSTYDRANRHPSPPDHFFNRLEAIEIRDSSVGSLFSSLIATKLDSLKELRISKCKNMVRVIEDEKQFFLGMFHVVFPRLHSLYLDDLPKLKSFSRWSTKLKLDSLENVWIKGCHRLEFFTMQRVELPSLKKVVVCDCNNIGSLFSSSTAKNIENLTTLSIFTCMEMVRVIENYDAHGVDELEFRKVLFPNLKELEIYDLPKLQSFCYLKYDLELPSLESIVIDSCPLWEEFSMGFVGTPNLKRIKYKCTVCEANHFINGSTPQQRA